MNNSDFFNYLRTLRNLGLTSILRVAYYRISIKLRFNKALYIQSKLINDSIYNPPTFTNENSPIVNCWEKKAIHNSYFDIEINNHPPDWFYNKFSKAFSKSNHLHWSKIKDFDPALGDIKPLWDLSRFDWIIPLSQQASKGEIDALEILNTWLIDWQQKNPPYNGVNWKCGQEASLRVLHLIMGAFILGQLENPTETLLELVKAHLKRIEPTLLYAIGQNNNHGTSEAAALYVGGAFLIKNGINEGEKWYSCGRRIIVERLEKLVGENGTFSQYSLNYHRLMLDTVCCCEIFRQKLELPRFDALFYRKASLAANWLFAMVDESSGDGPNIGANDGAKIIPLTNSDYRDFRPTVQLACALFNSKKAYSDGIWNDQFTWLKLSIPLEKMARVRSLIADDGGFAMLRINDVFTCLRYPRFKFRPSQNDILHLDLWVRGASIFKDGGSYSYNADTELMNYFGSISAHNSIQFDSREPMQKISRFLYGNWVTTNWIADLRDDGSKLSYGAGYTSMTGASHHRMILFSSDTLQVIDQVESFREKATLRWRLSNDDWQLFTKENQIIVKSEMKGIEIKIDCSEEISQGRIVKGFESLYYLNYNELSVLEVIVTKKCTLTTVVTW